MGDAHFESEFPRQFEQRSWELYVGSVLLGAGFRLQKSAAKGPDFVFDNRGTRVWIEATAVALGQGADAVPERNARGREKGQTWFGAPPPETSLLLRAANGFGAKVGAFERYLGAGIVEAKDCKVIAITLGLIEDADVEPPDLPLAVKLAFGVGEFYRTVSIDGGPFEQGYSQRHHVAKRNGACVSTHVFAKGSESISALILGRVAARNFPSTLGSELVLVHNPWATAPLPRKLLPNLKGEYEVRDGVVQLVSA